MHTTRHNRPAAVRSCRVARPIDVVGQRKPYARRSLGRDDGLPAGVLGNSTSFEMPSDGLVMGRRLKPIHRTGDKDMPRQTPSPDQANHLYQRSLAEALVASLGFDAALEACQNNGWQGVLGVLLAELRHSSPATA